MKKIKPLFLLLALLLASCSDYDEGKLPDRQTLIEETPAPQTGEDGAVVTIGDFMDSFLAGTRSWNGRPTISGVRTTSTAAYRRSVAHYSGSGAIGTRSEGEPEDDIPVYEITLQNADGTEGFALVVEPEQYFQDVVAFVPVGAIADTAFNRGLADWITAISPTFTTNPGGFMQDGWEGLGTDIPGTEEYVRPMTQYEIDTYNFKYSFWGPVDDGAAYGPFLKTEWAQTAPYNNRVPDKIIGTNERCKVGCANVAVGQIMAHYKHPANAYNWNLITATPKISVSNTAAASEVSRLLSDLADEMHTRYIVETGAGSTNPDNVVPAFNNWGYSVKHTVFLLDSDVTKPTIYSDVLNGRPVLVSASAWVPARDKYVSHMWVADGAFDFCRWYYYGSKITEHTSAGSTTRYELWRVRVKGNTLIHFNWGWGGLSNGWYRTYEPVYTDGEILDFERNRNLWTEIKPNR